MLQFARSQRTARASWLCADAEALPLAPASFDLVYSSLSMQWCEQLGTLFKGVKRVFVPGGALACATLGPGTLRELKQAWRSVDDLVHVNRFAPRQELENAMQAAGFYDLQWHTEGRVLFYPDLVTLTRELKALGAQNVNPGGPSGLTGRRTILARKAAYEHIRDAGQLPASHAAYYYSAVAGERWREGG